MAQCSKHHDKFLATVMMVSHFISGYFLSYIPIFMIRTSKCLPLITIKRNTLCFVIMVV
ncbi:hypothetical protein CXB51_015193 [Gossypium anomalum]|uniref:Uncharacterized protein n=1 Tax=Gossypium anomalum TaxID=47600 RepID=A0A8J5ZB22_9ROSI|nr:hypothetical protein CXB51_015193 [Gossypium anomalum]